MNPKNTIVIASTNKGKIRELGSLLQPFGLEVVGVDAFENIPEIEETGVTFEENALIKAIAVCELTGFVTLADDSGLEVDFLDKAPGVYSARYSATATEPATDPKNTALVLEKLQGVPWQNRTGRFVSCMAAARPDGATITEIGEWEGFVAEEPVGENGFGYDPVFFDPTTNCTAAEMTADQKNSRSHRGKAVRKLLARWPEFWTGWLENK